jgi:hypothetical protein
MSIKEVVGEKKIEDTRTIPELRKITLSGYPKNEIVKTIKDSILQNQVEIVCRWIAELHSGGDYRTLWNIIEEYYWKYVNIMNIRFWKYYMNRKNRWKRIMEEYKKENVLDSRNHNEIRNLLMDLYAILLTSPKHYEFVPIKIRESEMQREYLTLKLEFQNVQEDGKYVRDYIERIFQYGVNNEIKLIYYEILFLLYFTTSPNYCEIIQKNILQNETNIQSHDLKKKMREWIQRQFQKILYWIEWNMKWHSTCTKRRESIISPTNIQYAERYNYYSNLLNPGGNSKKRGIPFHWSFYIWDFLGRMIKMRVKDSKTREMIEYLEEVFFMNWKGNMNIVKNILYMAIYIFLMGVPKEKTLIHNKKVWYQVVLTSDEWYEEIQKNSNEWNEENWINMESNAIKPQSNIHQLHRTMIQQVPYNGTQELMEALPQQEQSKYREKTKKEIAMENKAKLMKRLSYLDNVVLCKKNPSVKDYFDSESVE